MTAIIPETSTTCDNDTFTTPDGRQWTHLSWCNPAAHREQFECGATAAGCIGPATGFSAAQGSATITATEATPGAPITFTVSADMFDARPGDLDCIAAVWAHEQGRCTARTVIPAPRRTR